MYLTVPIDLKKIITLERKDLFITAIQIDQDKIENIVSKTDMIRCFDLPIFE